jgi:predicted transcriptional regulator
VQITLEIEKNEKIGSLFKRLIRENHKIIDLLVDKNSGIVKSTVYLLINGKVFEACGCYDAVLNDGDTITFLPAYPGG